MRIANLTGCFEGCFLDCEIAQGVHGVGFVTRPNDKFFREFAVGEARQSKHARRVGRRRIAAKFTRQAVEQRFGLILTRSAYFPDDLIRLAASSLTGFIPRKIMWNWKEFLSIWSWNVMIQAS
jgi:hypothetical protein